MTDPQSTKQADARTDDSVLDDCLLISTRDTQCGHKLGILSLNSPKSLNALSVAMCQRLSAQLKAWEHDGQVVAVLLRGAGDKAFCAGGDIRKLYDSMMDNPPMPNPYAQEFFGNEYALYRQMHFYAKPLILWGNGIIMGGGMGLMAACSHRIITETTRFAMPETTIGLFPDATGSWFLQRMPARTGLFLGLTGAQCQGADAMLVNLAEYALPSSGYDTLVNALLDADWRRIDSDSSHAISHEHHIVSRVLAGLPSLSITPADTDSSSDSRTDTAGDPPQLAASKLAQHWQAIHRLMNIGGLADVDALLQDDAKLAQLCPNFAADPWAKKAIATYRQGCPVSSALTYELYHHVQDLSLEQILYLEANVATHCADKPDFREGVRALLIDKDRQPNWSRSLADCLTPEGMDYIAEHFSNPYPVAEHPFDEWLSDEAWAVQAVQGYLDKDE